LSIVLYENVIESDVCLETYNPQKLKGKDKNYIINIYTNS